MSIPSPDRRKGDPSEATIARVLEAAQALAPPGSPLDSAAVAARLGCSRKGVTNAARVLLRRGLWGWTWADGRAWNAENFKRKVGVKRRVGSTFVEHARLDTKVGRRWLIERLWRSRRRDDSHLDPTKPRKVGHVATLAEWRRRAGYLINPPE